MARELLARGLADLGASTPPGALERLAAFCELVAAWTARVDLTSHRTAEAVAEHLVLDAAALGSVAPPFESLVDLGAGAGIPSLPLAILDPGRRFTLVESRERRHHFQRMAIRELDLSNVEALRGRAEELAPAPHDAVVAQAVGPPPRALRLMLRWAAPGGALLLPGGERCPDPDVPPQVTVEARVSYRRPLGGPARSLWVGRAPAA